MVHLARLYATTSPAPFAAIGSAHCLRPSFELMALASFRQIPSQTLRQDLGAIGRRAEEFMLLTTGGTNTHRGAIWTLGLLVSAAAMGADSPDAVAYRARQLACLPERPKAAKQRFASDSTLPGVRCSRGSSSCFSSCDKDRLTDPSPFSWGGIERNSGSAGCIVSDHGEFG
jgi:hypothetical protein